MNPQRVAERITEDREATDWIHGLLGISNELCELSDGLTDWWPTSKFLNGELLNELFILETRLENVSKFWEINQTAISVQSLHRANWMRERLSNRKSERVRNPNKSERANSKAWNDGRRVAKNKELKCILKSTKVSIIFIHQIIEYNSLLHRYSPSSTGGSADDRLSVREQTKEEGSCLIQNVLNHIEVVHFEVDRRVAKRRQRRLK